MGISTISYVFQVAKLWSHSCHIRPKFTNLQMTIWPFWRHAKADSQEIQKAQVGDLEVVDGIVFSERSSWKAFLSYVLWDIYHINWCRISSINSMDPIIWNKMCWIWKSVSSLKSCWWKSNFRIFQAIQAWGGREAIQLVKQQAAIVSFHHAFGWMMGSHFSTQCAWNPSSFTSSLFIGVLILQLSIIDSLTCRGCLSKHGTRDVFIDVSCWTKNVSFNRVFCHVMSSLIDVPISFRVKGLPVWVHTVIYFGGTKSID